MFPSFLFYPAIFFALCGLSAKYLHGSLVLLSPPSLRSIQGFYLVLPNSTHFLFEILILGSLLCFFFDFFSYFHLLNFSVFFLFDSALSCFRTRFWQISRVHLPLVRILGFPNLQQLSASICSFVSRLLYLHRFLLVCSKSAEIYCFCYFSFRFLVFQQS